MSSPDDAAREFAPRLIGLELEDARRFAREHHFVVRDVIVDGEAHVVTADFKSRRINVATDHGVVVDAFADDDMGKPR